MHTKFEISSPYKSIASFYITMGILHYGAGIHPGAAWIFGFAVGMLDLEIRTKSKDKSNLVSTLFNGGYKLLNNCITTVQEDYSRPTY